MLTTLTMDNITIAALLQLYQDCRGRGENVNLSLDSKDGANVITFSVETQRTQLNFNDKVGKL